MRNNGTNIKTRARVFLKNVFKDCKFPVFIFLITFLTVKLFKRVFFFYLIIFEERF